MSGIEIGLLEAVRCFDDWAEIGWDEAEAVLENRLSRHALKLRDRGDEPSDVLSAERLLWGLEGEDRQLGPVFKQRVVASAGVLSRLPYTQINSIADQQHNGN